MVFAGDCACAVYFQSADRTAQLNDLEKNYGGGPMETLSSITKYKRLGFHRDFTVLFFPSRIEVSFYRCVTGRPTSYLETVS